MSTRAIRTARRHKLSQMDAFTGRCGEPTDFSESELEEDADEQQDKRIPIGPLDVAATQTFERSI